ncbi:hypothetical protein NMY22_g17966 [Coprinellus aureogranulatus]|nr:hypothetical protein NMY22_g17966 [Coprinellus aureogranulatus]
MDAYHPYQSGDYEMSDVRGKRDLCRRGVRVVGLDEVRQRSKANVSAGGIGVQPTRQPRKRRGDEMDVDGEGEVQVKTGGSKLLSVHQEQGKDIERPIRPLPSRKVSPAVPGDRHGGDISKQVEQLFEEKVVSDGKLSDLEGQVVVLRRQQEENHAAFSTRFDELRNQGHLTNEAHARRLDALEAKADITIDEGTLQSLMNRFGQLEAKVDAVEAQLAQEPAMMQRESAGDISELAAMGGWQGVVDHLKAEIKSVIESHDPNLTLQRVQSEIVQRFDSLSHILQAQQREQEQRNQVQMRSMLDGLLQRLVAISSNSGGHLDPGSVNQAFGQAMSSSSKGLSYPPSTAHSTFQPGTMYPGPSHPGASSEHHSTGSMNTYPQNIHSASVATLPPLSTDPYAMSQANQGQVQRQPHSYQGRSTGNMLSLNYGASTFMGPRPSDSISQRHSIGREQAAYDFGHSFNVAPPAEISILSTATDGSASSSTARDGGVPSP